MPLGGLNNTLARAPINSLTSHMSVAPTPDLSSIFFLLHGEMEKRECERASGGRCTFMDYFFYLQGVVFLCPFACEVTWFRVTYVTLSCVPLLT